MLNREEGVMPILFLNSLCLLNNILSSHTKRQIFALVFALTVTPRAEATLSRYRRHRADSLGKRLLQTEEFRTWHDESDEGKPVLFCYGGLGVGKTFIR